ncbi:MAG: hypothetical protein DRN30_06995 [Thermoplasmata archaeon]|nr:MAG: hypothetical protein DRN30_06995 [Thermoplasmata archaeon]
MDGKAQFYEAKRKLAQLYNDPHFSDYFRGVNEKNVKMSIQVMFEDLDRASNGVPVSVTDDKIKLIHDGVRLMLNVVMNAKLNDYIRNLAYMYATFAKNWCQNVKYNDDIISYANAIELLVTQNATILDAIDMMRMFLNKYRRVIEYSPPAFEVSKHFLEKMIENNESGD